MVSMLLSLQSGAASTLTILSMLKGKEKNSVQALQQAADVPIHKLT
jgi:hypothetical protein